MGGPVFSKPVKEDEEKKLLLNENLTKVYPNEQKNMFSEHYSQYKDNKNNDNSNNTKYKRL